MLRYAAFYINNNKEGVLKVSKHVLKKDLFSVKSHAMLQCMVSPHKIFNPHLQPTDMGHTPQHANYFLLHLAHQTPPLVAPKKTEYILFVFSKHIKNS